MKNRKHIKSLLILLSVVLSACMLVSGTIAAYSSVATGACTNMQTEGIEYLVYFGADNKEADKWRTNLTAQVVLSSDGTTSAGRVSSMEMETSNSSIRYQCTEVMTNEFSCNSMPINASITGVYIHYIPDTSVVTEKTNIRFKVFQTANPDPILMESPAIVEYPPYPCSRNYLVTRDFVAEDGKKLIINTTDCDKNGLKSPDDKSGTPPVYNVNEEHQNVTFLEQMDPFAFVNVLSTDTLDDSRLRLTISPEVSYNYTLTMLFEDFQEHKYTISWDYDGNTKTLSALPAISKDPSTAPDFDALTEANLPLTLISGTFEKISANGTDIWGNQNFPTSTDFDIKFWYTNTEGTLGYENAVFHFNRKLNIQFAPYCTKYADTMPMTGAAETLYDICDSTRQLFAADLTGGDPTKGVKLNTGMISFYNTNATDKSYVNNGTSEPGGEVPAHYFAVRKCVDAACASTTTTQAYLYSITVSDGTHMSRTYGNSGTTYHKPGTTSVFKLRAYGDNPGLTPAKHPFMITGVRLMVDEPGTYVVYPFLATAETWKKDVINDSDAAGKFYVTVTTNDSLNACSTLANNGYFKALWNDCMDPGLTQLMPFEHIQGKEEAWVRNTSGFGVHFPYVSEWSYVPQQLEVASLTCKFEALSAAGRPGDGYCRPTDVYVPPFTKVTITGGTLYLSSSPKYDDYYVAYARRDTWNISHLFFSIQVKECENAKIPDTGISLRSPLKVNESVDAATSYVFTGNSLRIPAIGLGMETPIPIVHVYYNEGSSDRGWDLSTLGNYVGELEGGTYLPYAGNSALTGHYYSMGVFKNLEGLNMGDEIIVYGNDGVKYIYKVVQKFITQPTDVYEMFQQVGERSLTLVTCENYNIVTDEYERRTIVRATIDSQDLYEEGIW